MFRVLAIVVVLVAPAAFAGKARISIQPFKGPKAAKVQKQLQAALCKSFTCVKPGKRGEVPVDAVVTGEVGSGKHAAVTFNVYFDEDLEPVSRELKLKSPGKLSAGAFKEAGRAVREAMSNVQAAEDDGEATLAAAAQ